MQIGLGDSNCFKIWQPYSSATITHIAEHEIGHFLGLAHNTDPNNIMYPVTQIQYGVVEIQKDFAPNYSWFVPMCTQKNNTSYSYSVTTSDPNYGFDVYFVPSQNEFTNWGKGLQFQYFSGNGCYAKSVLSFNGNCNGIAKGAGLLVIMPNQLTKPIETISVKMEEQTSLGAASPTATSLPSLQPPVQTPAPSPSPTPLPSPAPPEPTPAPTTNFVKTDQTQVIVSPGETAQVKIYGKVENPMGGSRVTITVTAPDSTLVVLQASVTSRGDFSTPIILDKYSLLGKYQIKAIYENTDLGSISFNATSKKIVAASIPSPTNETQNQSKVIANTPQPKLEPQPQQMPPVTSYSFPTQIKVNDTSFSVPYTISGGVVSSLRVNTDSNSLFVKLHPTGDGVLTLSLKRELVDSQKGGLDQSFFVTSGGQLIPYDEMTPTLDSRIITLNFTTSTDEIQITGTHVLPEFGSTSILLAAMVSLAIIITRPKIRCSHNQ